jgi:KEOPS complex subunit Cgi121
MERMICSGKCSVTRVHINIKDKSEFLNWIHDISKKYNCIIVCLNYQMIAGLPHIETAVTHAMRNREEEKGIARTPEMEILLYCAGTRQTSEISKFGPDKGENDLYLCLLPNDKNCLAELLTRIQPVDNDHEELSDEKKVNLMKWFGISENELDLVGYDRLTDLIRERSALLTINH